ncbi:MAG: HEAT repeat domain-containing protein [Planctomycetes bacterium]|nr:HEAT repeat domain-containing protein [Planctomycetota bacterium]
MPTRSFAAALLAIAFAAAPALADEVVSPEDLQKWFRNLGDPEYGIREAATERFLDAGAQALPTLLAGLQASDPEVRHRALYIFQTILRRLQPIEDRMRVLVRDALKRLTSKGSFGTGDPEYEEIVAIGRPAIPTLMEILAEKLEKEPEHADRIYSGAALAQIADPQDLSTLLPYLSDPNVHIRIHVGSSCSRIAGQDFGYDASGTQENWSAAREGYRKWWLENKERILREADAAEKEANPTGPSTHSGG